MFVRSGERFSLNVATRNYEIAKDLVLRALGAWMFMGPYFICSQPHQRSIVLAWATGSGEFAGAEGHRISHVEACMLDRTLPQLVSESFILPHSREHQLASLPEDVRANSAAATDPSLIQLKKDHDVSFGVHPSVESMDFLSIPASYLNAVCLVNTAGVEVYWTENISRHLLLCKTGDSYRLELFMYPHYLTTGGTPSRIGHSLGNAGISVGLIEEIMVSYFLLFNPIANNHMMLQRLLGVKYWCRCLLCSSRRLFRRENERKKLKISGIILLIEGYWSYARRCQRDNRSPTAPDHLFDHSWNQFELPRLWPRIKILEKHLSKSQSSSFGAIFRDRIDALQFWTFL